MNEAVRENTNNAPATAPAANQPAVNWTPRLAFYHANQNGTGSALTVEMSPATGTREGLVYMTIAPQDPAPANVVTTATGKRCAALKWRNRICMKLTFTEAAEVAMALGGVTKELRHAGKTGFYHALRDTVTTMDMRQSEDRPGVFLAVSRTVKGEDGKQNCCFAFSPAEAYGLRLALEQSMSLLAFGMTNSASAYATRTQPRKEEGASRAVPAAEDNGFSEFF